MLLSAKLCTHKAASTGADGKERVCRGVLEEGEGLVLLQAFRKVLGAFCTKAIRLQTDLQTANGSQNKTSGGADSRNMVCGGVLERDQDRILLQIIRQKHGVSNVESPASEIGRSLV